MVRSTISSITRPLRSKRPRISPTRPRRTASGLMSTSERSAALVDTNFLLVGTTAWGCQPIGTGRGGERPPPTSPTFPMAARRPSLAVLLGRSTVANQNGRPIAPARKLMAAVLGTIAVFVMVFGLGMSSWAIVALGVAMLALAIGIGMLNVVRRGARAWVSGTAQVKAVSDPPAT